MQFLFFAPVSQSWRVTWGRRQTLTRFATTDSSTSQLKHSFECGLPTDRFEACQRLARLGKLGPTVCTHTRVSLGTGLTLDTGTLLDTGSTFADTSAQNRIYNLQKTWTDHSQSIGVLAPTTNQNIRVRQSNSTTWNLSFSAPLCWDFNLCQNAHYYGIPCRHATASAGCGVFRHEREVRSIRSGLYAGSSLLAGTVGYHTDAADHMPRLLQVKRFSFTVYDTRQATSVTTFCC